MLRLKRFFPVCGILAALPFGCQLFLNPFNLGATTVRLVNKGSFPISVTIVYDESSSVPDSDIGTMGTQATYEIPAGGSQDIPPIPCPLIQAIKVLTATLETGAKPEPHTGSTTFRQGPDYACGDRIVFTFTHSLLLIDFSVDETRERP